MHPCHRDREAAPRGETPGSSSQDQASSRGAPVKGLVLILAHRVDSCPRRGAQSAPFSLFLDGPGSAETRSSRVFGDETGRLVWRPGHRLLSGPAGGKGSGSSGGCEERAGHTSGRLLWTGRGWQGGGRGQDAAAPGGASGDALRRAGMAERVGEASAASGPPLCRKEAAGRPCMWAWSNATVTTPQLSMTAFTSMDGTLVSRNPGHLWPSVQRNPISCSVPREKDKKQETTVLPSTASCQCHKRGAGAHLGCRARGPSWGRPSRRGPHSPSCSGQAVPSSPLTSPEPESRPGLSRRPGGCATTLGGSRRAGPCWPPGSRRDPRTPRPADAILTTSGGPGEL